MMRAVARQAPPTPSHFDNEAAFIGALAPTIVEAVEIPVRLPRVADMPAGYRRGVMQAVSPPGGQLWHHQALALEHVDAGDHVLVTTATGSGKSLIFHHPILRELVEGSGTALVLYPQKALGSDQLGRWRDELQRMGLDPELVAEINGQVSMNERGPALERARVVLATPDVIHAWLLRLQGNAQIQDFLSRLRFIVIDEAHMLDGVFGSNSAYFFRRLHFAVIRARADRNAPLQFIAASATIGEPLAHIEALTGCRFAHVSEHENGAPGHPMTLLHIEGADRGRAAETELATMISQLIPQMAGESLLVFGDTRQGVERVSEQIDNNRVQPYRNGYDRIDRQGIEQGLRDGCLTAAICTSAFEVGIDIDRFSIGMNLGVPATRRSLRQRVGRVGRSKPGLFAVVAPRSAFTKLGTTFEEFVTGPVEPNHLHLANRIIQYQQACCLRVELGDDEALVSKALDAIDWPDGFCEAMEWAAAPSCCPPEIDSVARLMGDSPHFDFPLRRIADVSFKLRLADDPVQTLGDITIDKAMREAYPGATYLHLGRRFRVAGWRRSAFEHSILLKREKRRVTTTPLLKTTVSASQDANDIFDRHNLVGAQGAFTECRLKISEKVFGYAFAGKTLLYSDLSKKNSSMRQQQRYFESTGVLFRCGSACKKDPVSGVIGV